MKTKGGRLEQGRGLLASFEVCGDEEAHERTFFFSFKKKNVLIKSSNELLYNTITRLIS